jgi:hypothetical protein
VSPETEIALRKQRLQILAEQQRAELMAGLAVVDEVLEPVDRLRDGLVWLRNNAPVVTTIVLVLVALRPRFALRWAKRGWLGWQLYRRLRGGLEATLSRL